ncbi:IS701 family transposase [Streptomyces filamentosus]|uniref:IS701 family transposase n=1 Tax=Streptomyces filamentosus TaxID=67294 RepID=UPI0033EED548
MASSRTQGTTGHHQTDDFRPISGAGDFTADVFGSLHRAEQLRWARACLWALARTEGRRTPHGLARTLDLPPAAARGLHQFVNVSPWDWRPVRARLAERVAGHARPYAWTVEELAVPKAGPHSVGVHTWPDPDTGRTVSGQRALGLFLVAPDEAFAVDWQLVLGGAWAWDRGLRHRARVPHAEGTRPDGPPLLDLAARAPARTGPAGLPWVLDLTRCAQVAGVLDGLARQGAAVLAEVPAELEVGLEGVPGRAATAGAGALTERLLARRPYPAVRFHPGTVRPPGAARAYRLLGRAAPDGRGPARQWLTDLPDRSLDRVVPLLRARARSAAALTVLRERYGLLDFAGRSFPGWHHHMTLVSAAHARHRLAGDAGVGR